MSPWKFLGNIAQEKGNFSSLNFYAKSLGQHVKTLPVLNNRCSATQVRNFICFNSGYNAYMHVQLQVKAKVKHILRITTSSKN